MSRPSPSIHRSKSCFQIWNAWTPPLNFEEIYQLRILEYFSEELYYAFYKWRTIIVYSIKYFMNNFFTEYLYLQNMAGNLELLIGKIWWLHSILFTDLLSKWEVVKRSTFAAITKAALLGLKGTNYKWVVI